MENERIWGDYGTVQYLDYGNDYITVCFSKEVEFYTKKGKFY